MDFNCNVLKRHLIFKNGVSAPENAESIQKSKFELLVLKGTTNPFWPSNLNLSNIAKKMDFNSNVLKRHLIFQNGVSAPENAESIQKSKFVL